jgi:hypothetical protein
MIGYCATASSGIAMAPIRQMNSATTQAKIGLSMKKLGIGQSVRDVGIVRGLDVTSADASALTHAFGLTLSPATNF